MNKRYKITITEFADEETLTHREWLKGGDKPNESGYGYAPQVKQIESVEREAFSQNTDELDLIKVIKAVNGIE